MAEAVMAGSDLHHYRTGGIWQLLVFDLDSVRDWKRPYLEDEERSRLRAIAEKREPVIGGRYNLWTTCMVPTEFRRDLTDNRDAVIAWLDQGLGRQEWHQVWVAERVAEAKAAEAARLQETRQLVEAGAYSGPVQQSSLF